MHRKWGSVGIPARMTECTQHWTLFQTNDTRKQTAKGYSATDRTAGVVYFESFEPSLLLGGFMGRSKSSSEVRWLVHLASNSP